MFNYKIKKFKVSLKKFFKSNYKYSETEIIISKLFTRILSKPDTKCFMSPSGRFFIQTGNKEYTLVLAENQVKITNHTFFLVTHLSDYMSQSLSNIVKKTIERSCKKMEDNIFSNEKNMLNEILEKW